MNEVESVELMLLLEYIALVEVIKKMSTTPDFIEEEGVMTEEEGPKIRQAVDQVDASLIEMFFLQAAKVMWMRPEWINPTTFLGYVQFQLKEMTLAKMVGKVGKIAQIVDGLEASVAIVYRAFGREVRLLHAELAAHTEDTQ